MRGFVNVTTTGWDAVYCVDGFANPATSEDPERSGAARSIANRVRNSDPGLYRMRVVEEFEMMRVTIGQKIKDPGQEAMRLIKLNDKPHTARTLKPGVAGYQEAERAAQARLDNIVTENRALAAFAAKIDTEKV